MCISANGELYSTKKICFVFIIYFVKLVVTYHNFLKKSWALKEQIGLGNGHHQDYLNTRDIFGTRFIQGLRYE